MFLNFTYLVQVPEDEAKHAKTTYYNTTSWNLYDEEFTMTVITDLLWGHFFKRVD